MPSLREVLNRRPKDRVIAAPGVYDMVSLRMAAAMGFDALYMTGYGTVASHLGLPDAGLASYSDMVGRVEAMARAAGAPLIADGDTGYGGLLNVRHTVRGYERAGAGRHCDRVLRPLQFRHRSRARFRASDVLWCACVIACLDNSPICRSIPS